MAYGDGVVDLMRSTVRAAGGVLWRERDDTVEVALVHRPKHQDWSLPKGKLHAGEHPLAAACREVMEETGVQPAVGVRLPSITYPVLTSGGAADKTVDYWVMRMLTTTGSFAPNQEVDELRWLSLEEVEAALSYRRDREVVAAFAALPRPLRTVLLVRHAPAAEEWDGPDVTRPLSPAGVVAAKRIAELLTLFAPTRLVSATPRRCVQTLDALAAGLGVEIESDGVFDAESHARAPEVTADRLGKLSSDGDGPVVICSEAGVIPDTVALLADSDGLSVPTVRTPEASAWALSFAGDKLRAADFISPEP